MVDWNKWEEYARGNRDMTRRDFMKAGGSAAAGSAALVDFLDDGDDAYSRTAGFVEGIWNWATPDQVDVDFEFSIGGDEDSNGNSGNGTTTGTTTTEEDWIASYDVSDFTKDLQAQGSASVASTEDFFKRAYKDGGNNIETAEIDGAMFQLNDISLNMYSDDPGLMYDEGFGEKLGALDDAGKLDETVEGYIEQQDLV